MVGQDLLVGIIGAAVLGVALVGVYAYESSGSESASYDVVNKVRHPNATGYVLLTRNANPIAVTGECLDMVAQACTNGVTDVYFNVSLPDAHAMTYVAFFKFPHGDHPPIGKLILQDGMYRLHVRKVADSTDALGISIGLEAKSTETTGSYIVSTLPLGPPGTPTVIDTKATVDWTGVRKNHTVDFTTENGKTSIVAKFDGLKEHVGMSYRGWMVKATEGGDETFTFVGNYTTGQKATVGEIRGSVPNGRSYYSEFIVTVEPTDAPIGSSPAGPEVADAEFG